MKKFLILGACLLLPATKMVAQSLPPGQIAFQSNISTVQAFQAATNDGTGRFSNTPCYSMNSNPSIYGFNWSSITPPPSSYTVRISKCSNGTTPDLGTTGVWTSASVGSSQYSSQNYYVWDCNDTQCIARKNVSSTASQTPTMHTAERSITSNGALTGRAAPAVSPQASTEKARTLK